MSDSTKKLILVGGPNGSGKTTFAMRYCEQTGLPYVGADAIAAKLNPENVAAARVPAAREFIETVNRLVNEGESFVCESTLAGKTLRNLIQPSLDPETQAFLDEVEQVADEAFKEAQEKSRRVGVANVYMIDGQIMYELPNGELSPNDPDPKPEEQQG